MALSFTEKRTLQKQISTNLAALAAGNVSFTDKRRLQREITEAMAKLNAKVETAPTYSDWERAVTDIITAKLDIPNGDAQGIVEAQAFAMRQAWGQGLDAQATADKVMAASAVKYYHLQTRNWNQSAEAKKLLDDTLQYGVIRYDNATGDNDDKYVLDTTDKALADKVNDLFKAAQPLSGGDVMYDVLDKPYADLALDATKPGFQMLADLQAGKFDSLDPMAFLGKLKEIADQINNIEPLKAPAISYIEKNSDKVNAVMESAMMETFGKLWSKSAGA